jgi:hypothetical protein
MKYITYKPDLAVSTHLLLYINHVTGTRSKTKITGKLDLIVTSSTISCFLNLSF